MSSDQENLTNLSAPPTPRPMRRIFLHQTLHCDSESDVVYQSSDNLLFHAHTINLKVCTGNFPVPQSGEVVKVPEISATLELLFRFCYPDNHPSLEHMGFNDLSVLAEAVEKYQVFPARSICKIRMRDILPHNAKGILLYAARWGYLDIVGKAAPVVVLETSLSEMLPLLPVDLVIPWALYHENWCRVAQDAVLYQPPGEGPNHTSGHSRLNDNTVRVLRELGAGPRALKNLDTLLPPSPPSPFGHNFDSIYFDSLRTFIEGRIATIPTVGMQLGPSLSPLDFQLEWGEDSIPEPGPPADSEPVPIGVVSQRFSAEDSDVTFQSSDGMLFKLHKVNLKVSAAGFCPPEFETRDEVVHLPEDSSTLGLLFQFCYPEQHPNLEHASPRILMDLAEAAEKYEMFSAMNVCHMFMKARATNPCYAHIVVAYAAKHGYNNTLDDAASVIASNECLSETLPKLPGYLFLPWVRYYEHVHDDKQAPGPRSSRGKKIKGHRTTSQIKPESTPGNRPFSTFVQ